MVETISERDLIKDAERAIRTGNDLNVYLKDLGVQREEFRDKLILDVGSGDSPFAVEALSLGAKVVRLDPTYLSSLPKNTDNIVIGLAQNLPFKTGVFDETIAAWSLFWVNNFLDRAVLEMIRVTKEEGTIRICPIPILANLRGLPDMVRAEESGHGSIIIKKKSDMADWSHVAKKVEDIIHPPVSFASQLHARLGLQEF